jgi:predicted nucleic acid-binding protein
MTEMPSPPPDRDPREAVEFMLSTMHGRSVAAPLEVPSVDGAFPAASIVPPRPLVGDTRFLGGDVGYACRKGQRTTLVTATNAQVFRLYCSQHVVDEVVEHHGIWSGHARTTVKPEQFLARWRGEYLRVIRVVPDDAIPDSWFSPPERARLSQLAIEDADDIPSVELALAVRGLYLSKDNDALRAAYGAAADLIDHEQWLARLQAGSDAAELMRMLRGAGALTVAAGDGAFRAARWIYGELGDVAMLLGGLAAALGWLWVRDPARASLRSGAGKVIEYVATIGLEQRDREQHFLRALPPVASWSTLLKSNDADDVLGRACLHDLAREPCGHLSASELAAKLRRDFACSDARVRAILRSTPCFTEVYRGRWQVGHAAVSPSVGSSLAAMPARLPASVRSQP